MVDKKGSKTIQLFLDSVLTINTFSQPPSCTLFVHDPHYMVYWLIHEVHFPWTNLSLFLE